MSPVEPEPLPGKDGGRKAQPGQGRGLFLCEEMRAARREEVDLSWKGCEGRTTSPFLWAEQLLLHLPWGVLPERDSAHLRPHPPDWSGSPPRCLMVLGEGGVKSQAQDIYRQCGLTFLPREERSRKEG